mmetsp:Transcript_33267/g.37096  ORF Transcript_33267/g.37096 Transcript_33267/m.37096 type:complete len:269 (+) Transcript_33267:97-903(+)
MDRYAVAATNSDKGLDGFPRSHIFKVGFKLWLDGHHDLAIATFKRGAKDESCVCCMFYYLYLQDERDNINPYLLLPLALEGSIRGQTGCMHLLVDYYNEMKPARTVLISNYWLKLIGKLGKPASNEERKEIRKQNGNICVTCGKEDSKDRTFNQCSVCKYYSYCCKDHQIKHWKKKGGNHVAECRHFMILKEYCKPQYVREIKEAIIRGDDPKSIVRLQTLRTHLGLNRPKEEYEELMLRLNDGNNNECVGVANSDGTVCIGSSPEAM